MTSVSSTVFLVAITVYTHSGVVLVTCVSKACIAVVVHVQIHLSKL